MSTTPSTSDIPYTIVGGSRVQKPEQSSVGLSILVLDRGSRTLRAESLELLLQAGVDEVVVVVGPAPHYDVEQLASRIDRTRFILLREALTGGERVNIGLRESVAERVLVMWSDYTIHALPERFGDREHSFSGMCAVPAIRGDRGGVIPSITAPAFHGNAFRTIPTLPGKHTPQTLFPYDFVGIYNRENCWAIGGYDEKIANPYWQKLDFGLRTYLWGSRITVAPDLRLDAERPIPQEDTSPDPGYSRFHLKNLGVRFGGDSGRLPLRRLFSFLLKSGLGPAKSAKIFFEVRRWVRENRYRFVQDAGRVIELWEVGE